MFLYSQNIGYMENMEMLKCNRAISFEGNGTTSFGNHECEREPQPMPREICFANVFFLT